MREIVLGRDAEDLARFGKEGLAFLAKHYVETGGRINLANPVLMDLVRPHVLLICGKRGQGKSYTLGVIAEEIALLPRKYREKLTVVIFDTMGIYWTMRYPNIKQETLLKKWDLEPRAMDVNVFAPERKIDEYKKSGIEVDFPLAVHPADLSQQDWLDVFGLEAFSQHGVALQKATKDIESLDDIKSNLMGLNIDVHVRDALMNLIDIADSWGIFSSRATRVEQLMSSGKINVLDISILPMKVKHLLIGILSRKIMDARIMARKFEERQTIEKYVSISREGRVRLPMPWIFIDEAHEFLPEKGSTPSSRELIRVIREGRQPGVTLVLATQQPGKIHTDVMTQADIVLSHRVTAMQDIEALNTIMGTYMHQSLEKYIRALPRVKGSAVVLDDNAEKVYNIRVRPRLSWHGGESASLIR